MVVLFVVPRQALFDELQLCIALTNPQDPEVASVAVSPGNRDSNVSLVHQLAQSLAGDCREVLPALRCVNTFEPHAELLGPHENDNGITVYHSHALAVQVFSEAACAQQK